MILVVLSGLFYGARHGQWVLRSKLHYQPDTSWTSVRGTNDEVSCSMRLKLVNRYVQTEKNNVAWDQQCDGWQWTHVLLLPVQMKRHPSDCTRCNSCWKFKYFCDARKVSESCSKLCPWFDGQVFLSVRLQLCSPIPVLGARMRLRAYSEIGDQYRAWACLTPKWGSWQVWPLHVMLGHEVGSVAIRWAAVHKRMQEGNALPRSKPLQISQNVRKFSIVLCESTFLQHKRLRRDDIRALEGWEQCECREVGERNHTSAQ